jgi:hypothetical protein
MGDIRRPIGRGILVGAHRSSRRPTAGLRHVSQGAVTLFLAAVAGMLVWHVLHGVDGSAGADHWLATSHWSVERDRGYPELFGYALLVVAVVGLLVLGRRGRRPSLYAWAATFALVLLDDEMMIHERGGRIVVRLLGSPAEIFGVRAQDVGELAVWGGLAVLPLIAVVLLHRRSDRFGRELDYALGLLLGALVFFGVVVDQLHSMFWDGIPVVGPVMGVVEDGGELVVLSFLAAFVVGVLQHRDAAKAVVAEDDDRIDVRV